MNSAAERPQLKDNAAEIDSNRCQGGGNCKNNWQVREPLEHPTIVMGKRIPQFAQLCWQHRATVMPQLSGYMNR